MGESTSEGSASPAVCTCSQSAKRSNRIAKWSTAGGLLSALGICAACCLLPFAMVTAGVATAWAGTLEGLAPYKWLLIAATAALLGYGFFVAYRKPRVNGAAGETCEACSSKRSLWIGLWVVTAVALAGLVFEQIEPHLK